MNTLNEVSTNPIYSGNGMSLADFATVFADILFHDGTAADMGSQKPEKQELESAALVELVTFMLGSSEIFHRPV